MPPARDIDRAPPRRRFDDRRHAGRVLAGQFEAGSGGDDVVVLGLLRGGVPVAAEVARRLGSPLGALSVRKIGFPGQPELARGAVTANGALVLNDPSGAPGPELQAAVERAQAEARDIEQRFRPPDGGPRLSGRAAVLVDDGLATGATMRAAVAGARLAGSARVTVAVPVGSLGARDLVAADADLVVCAHIPRLFGAVGNWYRDFSQLDDDDVRSALGLAG